MNIETKIANRYFYLNYFLPALDIVAGKKKYWNPLTGDWDGYRGRQWFSREYKRYEIHPCISHVMHNLCYRPHDWHQLLLEYPHRSTTDYNRLAYTRDDRAGEADKQVVTTIGKYLYRHFPDMPDHVVRDVVALFTANGDMTISDQLDDIVRAAIEGPRSCMSENFAIKCSDGVLRHPYEVYDPALGWRMATRVSGSSIDGRALVYKHHSTGEMVFVRSYKRDSNNGYSYADESLESWLKSQGVDKIDTWGEVSARMQYFPVGDTFLMPYLDGSSHCVVLSSVDGVTRVVADTYGDYECDRTDGRAQATGHECEDCGDHADEDDMYWVGIHQDRRVCNSCIDSYRYAYSRRGDQYYIHEDNVVFVESMDDYYDLDYLADNSIVELLDGDYEHTDNAVEVDGDWYHNEDSDICWDEYNERQQLERNCVFTEDMGLVHADDTWECNATGKHYTDNVERVEVDGNPYHPDHAPETNETNE